MNRHPASPRAALRRLTALLLITALALGGAPWISAASRNSHFVDVTSRHWASPYVERAYADGAIAGTGGDPQKGSGIFSPDTKMTYGQFLTMLTSAFYSEELARVSKEGPWYAPALRVAVDRELIYFDLDQLMKMADWPVDRYRMAWVLVRILDDKCVVLPTDQEREAAAQQIADWNAVQTDGQYWPYFVANAYALGLIRGVDDRGTFAGNDSVTRASAAVIYTNIADKLKAGQNNPKAFQLILEGQWEGLIPAGVREALEEEFYAIYPRLWARWGNSGVSKHVTLALDHREAMDTNAGLTTPKFDSTRYQYTPYIRLSIEDINRRPNNRMTFAHELTHAATNTSTGVRGWLRECLADYGAFRYASMADEKYFSAAYQYSPTEQSLRDWHFTVSSDSVWFLAYMDSKYPTTKTSRGLLDSMLTAMQNGQITSDGGTAQNDTALNALVKEKTGFSSLETLRQKYVQELDAGTWTCNSFSGYIDNFLTENIPNVPNPSYFTGKGRNLCSGSYTYDASGESFAAAAGNMLVDGNASSRWEASPSDGNGSNAQHHISVSFGKPVTFDTYTLYHAGSQGNSSQNTVSWRFRYYDSKTNSWPVFDEVTGNTQDVTTRTFQPVTTQYIRLDVLNASADGDGTVRLYELEVSRKG